ncbi:MAG: 3'-5' exonuclease, partial [Prolixibacteraceae bacterium]|nr:3'-5' exonuclease [Prolixibacteraceae bacterium]
MDEIDNILFMEKAWEKYLSNLKNSNSSILKNLEYSGIEVKDLKGCYQQVCLYPDIEINFQSCATPNLKQAFEKLVSFCEEALPYIPQTETEKGYDRIQEAILLVLRLKNYTPFIKKDFNIVSLLENFNKDFSSSGQITQNRWLDKAVAKEYKEEVLPELKERYIEPAIKEWQEYCHYHVFQFIMPAVNYYHDYRDKYSLLNFQDLLIKTARLLQNYSDVRRYFQKKYPVLLVDEFQDTDPLQAEIIFYLTGSDTREKDWQKIVPRPGSLFIVGDPQQSIYHFRRADIAVYQQVKGLIEKSGGKTLQLNSNFRSLKSIADYLNPVFADLFSAQQGEFQAQYASMEAIRDGQPGHLSGIRQLIIGKDRLKEKTIENDARAIAQLIKKWVTQKYQITRREEEMHKGITSEVDYNDFMILLRYKKGMDVYARVLSEYDIPATVTGSASINQSAGVRELLKLLRLLRDPENEVLLVAVLRGIFYGFSDEELYKFKDAGGVFDFTAAIPTDIEQTVRDKIHLAFENLNCYYAWSKELLPTQTFSRILTCTGLRAASHIQSEQIIQENELYYLLEYLQKLEMDRFYTFTDMVAEIERLCEAGVEEEYDLQAESNTVRIMNLHKAKGLEAPIVFLAIPFNNKRHAPDFHVQRRSAAPAGHFIVKKTNDYGNGKIIAKPAKWEDYSQTETLYLKAEETRLLYVAATRAKNLLIISSLGKEAIHNENIPWGPLLKEIREEMILTVPEMPAVIKSAHTTASFSTEEHKDQLRNIAANYQNSQQKKYLERTPSNIKNDENRIIEVIPTIDKGGVHWGKTVHEVLEYLITNQPSAELLSSFIVYSLEKNNLAVIRKEELEQLICDFQNKPLFKRIMQAEKRLAEIPFHLKVTEDDPLYQELTDAEENNTIKSLPIILNGIIDLAFKEEDGWIIVDYKTDCPQDKNDFGRLEQIYQKQIDIYE